MFVPKRKDACGRAAARGGVGSRVNSTAPPPARGQQHESESESLLQYIPILAIDSGSTTLKVTTHKGPRKIVSHCSTDRVTTSGPIDFNRDGRHGRPRTRLPRSGAYVLWFGFTSLVSQ